MIFNVEEANFGNGMVELDEESRASGGRGSEGKV